MPATTTVRKISIKVDSQGAQELSRIAKEMGSLSKNTKSLSSNMGFLSNAFRGWLGFLGIREVVQMSDSMQNLTNRLQLVTGSTEGAKEALLGLSGVAQRTNQTLTAVGDVYNRFAISLKSSGASTSELLALTETLSNSFRVAGASSDETRNAMVQLSQAFSIGVLRGQDLRSVLSQNANLATLLKERYGADLFKKAEQGAITVTEVLKLLAKNQADINNGAKKLAPTFEQTLSKSMNTVSLAVGELNSQYSLSAKFATVMEFAVNHLAEILTGAGAIIAGLAVVQIPIFIDAINKARLALIAFTTSNPYTAAFAALAAIAVVIYANWEKVVDLFNRFRSSVQNLYADILEKLLPAQKAVAGVFGKDVQESSVKDTEKWIATLRDRAKDIGDLTKTLIGAATEPSKGKSGLQDMQKLLDSLASKMKNVGAEKSLKGELSDLNKLYLSGAISLGEYNKRLIAFQLHKVTQQFKEGKTDIFKYHEALRDLKIEELRRQLDSGKISLKQFNDQASAAKLAVLNEQLDAGRIGLQKYADEVAKLEDKFRPGASFYNGVSDFIKSAGTLSEGIAKVTTQAFDHLADTLTDFIKTGKFQFADFTKAILDDLTAMLVRAAIVRPIAQGILGAFGSSLVGAAAGGGGAAAGGGGFSLGVDTNLGFGRSNQPGSGVTSSPVVALGGARQSSFAPTPELRAVPSAGGAGGVSVVQTVNVYSDGSTTTDSKTVGDSAKQLGTEMERVAVATIIKHKRPGGLLS